MITAMILNATNHNRELRPAYDEELYDCVVFGDPETGLPEIGTTMYGKLTCGGKKYYDTVTAHTPAVEKAQKIEEEMYVTVTGGWVYKLVRPKYY